MLGTQYPSVSQSSSQNTGQFTNIVHVQTTPKVITELPNPGGAASQANTVPPGQTHTPMFNVGQTVRSPGTQTPRPRGRGRGKGKKKRGNSVPNPGFNPEHQINMINQQEQAFQQHTPAVQATEVKQMFKDSIQKKSAPGQGQNRPNVGQGQNKQNVGQGQGQKGHVQPVRLVRSDSQGKPIATYSAMPTKTEEGRTVYKLKIENVQKRIVQASPSTPTKRTVVAGSGQGQVARKIVTNTNEPEPSRTVVATGRVSHLDLIFERKKSRIVIGTR